MRGPIEQLLSESLNAGDGHDAVAVNLLINKILRVGHAAQELPQLSATPATALRNHLAKPHANITSRPTTTPGCVAANQCTLKAEEPAITRDPDRPREFFHRNAALSFY